MIQTVRVFAQSVQEGNLFVGAASGIFRVRFGTVMPFALGSEDANDPGFFDFPHDVIVDSRRRVVWLAPLGVGSYANHVGLFRTAGEGATPERLAIFRGGSHDLDEGYPNPLPNLRFAEYDNGPPVVRLQLASNRRIEINDLLSGRRPRVVTEESYVMGLISGGNGGISRFSSVQTIAYGTDTGIWHEELPDPIYNLPSETLPHYLPPVDLLRHAGAVYSIDGNRLRRSSAPLRLDASVTVDLGPLGSIDFRLGLRLFGGDNDVLGIVINDSKIIWATRALTNGSMSFSKDAAPLLTNAVTPALIPQPVALTLVLTAFEWFGALQRRRRTRSFNCDARTSARSAALRFGRTP